jgi:hypothetical protein
MTQPEEHRAIDFRRQRSVSDIINVTFVFLRDEFRGLMVALLYIVGPLMLAAGVLTIDATLDTAQGMFSAEFWMDPDQDPLSARYLIGLGLSMVSYLLAFGVFYAYVMLYADGGPGPFSPGEVWQRLWTDLGRYVSTILWIGLIVTALVLLNIIPCLGTLVFLGLGIYLSPILMLVFPARFDRREGFFSALGRCRELVRGEWASSFGLLFVMQVLVIITGMAISALVMGLHAMITALLGTGILAQALGVLVAVASVVTYAAYVLPAVGFVVHYFNLVEQKEGVGLEDRIEAMAANDPARRDELAL